MVSVKLHKYIYVYTAYVRICRVIWVNNKLLAGRKCDISVCTADIFKHRDYLVRGKSVFSYCGIILLTRPDYTFSRRATFSPDAFINVLLHTITELVFKFSVRWNASSLYSSKDFPFLGTCCYLYDTFLT